MIVGYLSGSLSAWAFGPTWYSARSWRSYLLYSAKYQSSAILAQLYPNPDHARVYADELERLRLNVFAEDRVRPDALTPTAERPLFVVDGLNGRPPDVHSPLHVGYGDAVIVKGWAFNARSTAPAAAVFLAVDGARFLPVAMNQYREDFGGNVRLRWRRWSGFTGSFGGFVLPEGEHTLALAIVVDDRHLYVSEPFTRVIRE